MGTSAQPLRLNKKVVVTTISIVTLVILAYSLITGGYQAFLEINAVSLVLAIAVYMISWLITALRLMFLHKKLGDNKIMPIHHYFYARLLGGLMAYLTPSAIGGEPARAYYLYKKLGGSYPKYLALVVYEVFYDVVVVCTIATGFALYALPLTIPVIIVGVGNLGIWIMLYGLFNNIVNPRQANPLISKILLFIEEKIVRRKTLLENGYSTFGLYFRKITRSMGLSSKLVVVLLTILSNITASLTIFIIGLTHVKTDPLVLFINSIVAFYYSSSLGAIPSPGGAMVIEYGLSITLDPAVVVISRTIMYYTVIISGFLILVRTGLSDRSK